MLILSSQELGIITKSYIELSHRSENVFEKFYSNFFLIDPSAKNLFTNVDLKKQRQMLFESISYFISSDEITDQDIDEYVETLKNIHQSVHIALSQYDSFKKAFIKTFREAYGSSFTVQIEQIWSKLLDEILKRFSKKD